MADSLERRVAHLERQNRRMRSTLLAVLVLAVIAASGRPAVPELLQAERFQLLDGEGRVRADLGHGDDGTTFYLKDSTGTTRVGVAQFSHGGGGFALHGPDGKGAAVLYLKGSGSLMMFDSAGTITSRFPEATRE